jgi:hypothetical protein
MESGPWVIATKEEAASEKNSASTSCTHGGEPSEDQGEGGEHRFQCSMDSEALRGGPWRRTFRVGGRGGHSRHSYHD